MFCPVSKIKTLKTCLNSEMTQIFFSNNLSRFSFVEIYWSDDKPIAKTNQMENSIMYVKYIHEHTTEGL